MTQRDVWSSARLHSESHNLPFHKDKEQHKNLHTTESLNQYITLHGFCFLVFCFGADAKNNTVHLLGNSDEVVQAKMFLLIFSIIKTCLSNYIR